jgi:redox-sensitive bicupin YhaK (pirin superfamily)
VRLRRAFGFGATSDYDPFLLLDDFRNERPEDYLPGFSWHPHRGIETITYVLAGTAEHGDSMENRGSIGAGDIRWMTAGRGIIHQEMPTGDAGGRMHGFQLWANLPSSLKMTRPGRLTRGRSRPRGAAVRVCAPARQEGFWSRSELPIPLPGGPATRYRSGASPAVGPTPRAEGRGAAEGTQKRG